MLPQQPQQPVEPPEPGERVETRAAARSAERAAAVAATEGFHPLRVRPYVNEPGGETGRSTVRPLLVPPQDGPATTDLGLFPAMYSGLEYPQEEPLLMGAGVGAGTAEGAYAEHAATRGRHRRRRRSLVVAAAAAAASALAAGAVAVTGQVMGNEQGTTDRALPPNQGLSMPDVELPSEAADTSGTAAPMTTHRSITPRSTPSTTAATTPPATGPASPTAPATAATPPVQAAPVDSATPSPADPADPATAAPTTPPAPTLDPATTTPDVLREGDSGPAVSDLQRRLTRVWVYRGDDDGDFDGQVERAVAMFQLWYGVSGDPVGVYGPHTRSVLERQTS